MTVLDIHTHHQSDAEAVISCSASDFAPLPGRLYSVGVHPWDSAEADEAMLGRVAALASHPQVVAIGEAGLDTLRGAPLERQTEILEWHIALADELGKPLIVHCVRAAQPLVQIWRRTAPHCVPLVVHGFRGNGRVAHTLLDAGLWLSYGARFQADALRGTPLGRLLLETDEAPLTISEVAAGVADALALPVATVVGQVRHNVERFLSQHG